ncbi:MAG: DUF523 and DUF1722 domain-containing protein [Syntrophales bacterium]|nr:DUF523 and DUF1722 domain-containing protein [Syntrophales bacterium]MDD4339033.1 DUF523 and DUF1722 domain-containing protein [Syntrophales bacterium]HOG08743.1 DUF523 and DUF1722 domain-containing protein [Syntrophales bacterium]HOS77471.1 DUF523 and DUF1722 domain-containing protein [Syntrophales bacterium]HPB69825.1 DUF523 and DUF1722 domain-containing protein [Syntrophales bacterium]
MEKIRVGISTCLLGKHVRYDGGHQEDRYLTHTLSRYFDWVPVCPEVEYGLGVPREAMRLVGDPERPRLVTIRTAVDHTDGMKRWARERLSALEREGLGGFVFKSKSPSSGMAAVKVYPDTGGSPVKKGVGIFAAALMERFPLLPVEEDGRLHDPSLRETFLERIFVYHRWRELWRDGGRMADLVRFHAEHKLLLLSHSPKHVTLLGRLVANPERRPLRALREAYLRGMMEGLKLPATTRKNTNVLDHMAGYFKKRLTADEKEELRNVIDRYHRGLVPLVVPLTLLGHYVRRYDEPYLKRQVYLNPHPLELMLRNHV